MAPFVLIECPCKKLYRQIKHQTYVSSYVYTFAASPFEVKFGWVFGVHNIFMIYNLSYVILQIRRRVRMLIFDVKSNPNRMRFTESESNTNPKNGYELEAETNTNPNNWMIIF